MRLGLQGVLYYSAGSRDTWAASPTNGIYIAAAPSGLVIVHGVKDLSINLEKDEADVSTRDGAPFEQVVGSLIKSPLDITFLWNSTDPGQQALLSAFLTPGTYVPIAALEGPKATAGYQGIWMDAEVLKFGRGEKLKEGMEVTCSLKASGWSAIPPQWVQTA